MANLLSISERGGVGLGAQIHALDISILHSDQGNYCLNSNSVGLCFVYQCVSCIIP